MQLQRCPNCRERNDVSVYVHGQLARCNRCGLRFTVDREAFSSSPNDPKLQSIPGLTSSGNQTEAPSVPPPKATISSGQLFLTPAERPKAPSPIPDVVAPKAPAPPPPKAEVPIIRPTLPGYDCLDLLGRGGMGEVWRARQHSLNRIVAIKVLSSALAVEPDFVRRFERESTALASLSHPNIVTVYDRGSANKVWYFVMEFVEGRSLRDRVTEGRPPRVEILRILGQVARAVEHAHKRGVIHRDLKPENVLLDHTGSPKVADFGLAGMSEIGRSSLTMTAVAMGTAHYMAPEQRRDAKNVDGRADIYSLGVMLYESLCAEIPSGKFPTPREKLPDLDPRLDAIIMRMLDQDPERRPTRAGEIAETIEAVLTAPPRPVPPPSPATVLRPQTQRPLQSFIQQLKEAPAKQAMLAGAAMLLVLAIGVAIAHAGGSTSPPLMAKVDHAEGSRSSTLAFGVGNTSTVIPAAGGWSTQDGQLVRAPSHAEAKTDPHAWLHALPLDLTNASVEAEVEIDSAGSADQPAFAELVLKRNDRQVAVRVALGDEVVPTLLYTDATKPKPARVEGPHDSIEAGHKYRLMVSIVNGKATATLDHHPIGSALVGGISGDHGEAGFGCEVGRCRFSNVRVVGGSAEHLTTAQKG